jgi:hypothetical protein
MLNTTRVAFVACGTLRNFSECYNTWNIFKQQHNYVFTWDTDYAKTCNRTEIEIPALAKIEDLRDAKKQNHIIDYNIFKEPTSLAPVRKSPYLWSILDNYISYDYDYIFITRPDMWLQRIPVLNTNYVLPKENEVQMMHVDHINRMTSDTIFLMTRTTYKRFSNIFTFLTTEDGSTIHHDLYKFFSFEGLKITDTLKFYINPLFYRTQSIINKNNELQVIEEDVRCRDLFNKNTIFNNTTPNNIVAIAILLISPIFLTDEYKKINYHAAIKKYIDLHGQKNYNWRIFEASTVEMGKKKIEEYQKISGITISDTHIMEC